eukprot:7830230-Alexandrium_andersonii.AAC.1
MSPAVWKLSGKHLKHEASPWTEKETWNGQLPLVGVPASITAEDTWWGARVAEGIPTITPDMLETAMADFPSGKAPGPDG